jgi:hypothetical protein
VSRRGALDRALLALGALVLVSAAARFALSRGVAAPWIAPDEQLYGLLGRSLVRGDGLEILGEASPYYSFLYPLLVGLPFLGNELSAGVTGVQGLQALLMSATAVPVYLWARPMTGPRWALVAAALAVLVPGLAYSGLLMSEALYYPAAVLAAWALASCLREPTLTRQAMFLGALGVALATRLQAVGFVGVLVVALALLAVFERSAAPFRRLLPTLAVLVAAGVAWIGVRVALGGVGELLGAYAPLTEAAAYSFGGVARSIAWHTGAVALLTIAIPLVALGVLAWEALRGREEDARVRALVATAVAYLTVTVVEVSAFASRFVEHVTERQLLSVVPPVFVAFAVWLHRGLPRPMPATSLVAIAVAAPTLMLPLDRVATPSAAADAPSTIPLEKLGRHLGESALEASYAGTAALLVALAVFVPRRSGPALAALVATILVAGSLVASLELRDLSRKERLATFAGAPTDWIDRSGARDAALLVTPDRFWPSAWQELFWNEAITSVVGFPESDEIGIAPQSVVVPELDGTLRTAAGDPVEASYVVAPATVLVDGEQIVSIPPSAEQHGLVVWRTGSPVRIAQRIRGLRPNGDLHGGEAAQVRVYSCGPGGRLELTLLGKQGLPTRILLEGRVVAERAIPPSGVWRPSVPAPASADGTGACVYELRSDGLVGSTRIEFVRGD